MEYIKLNNGINMPLLGFGTYSIYGKECEKCVAEAIESGYRLIDTAQMYSNERAVGNAIRHFPREELFITTKLYNPSRGYDKAKSDIEKSLNELQIDYIDLLLIHEPYKESTEMYRAMEEGIKNGKLRAIGVSNFNKAFYLEFIKSCAVVPAVNQVEAHVFYPQFTLKKILEEHNTCMQAWSPLACGRSNIFTNPVLKTIGSKYGKTPAQVGLKYLVQSGISVIPKSANTERIKQNIDIFDFTLTQEDITAIKTLDCGVSLFGWY